MGKRKKEKEKGGESGKEGENGEKEKEERNCTATRAIHDISAHPLNGFPVSVIELLRPVVRRPLSTHIVTCRVRMHELLGGEEPGRPAVKSLKAWKHNKA